MTMTMTMTMGRTTSTVLVEPATRLRLAAQLSANIIVSYNT
jgi:hypothetical protein